jgi:hypothetical protein
MTKAKKSTGLCIDHFHFEPEPCDSLMSEQRCYVVEGCTYNAAADGCYRDGEEIECGVYKGEEVCVMEAG